MRGLSLVAASGGHSASQCAGLSLSRPLVAEHRLQTHRHSNCGSQVQLLRGMWDLPRPGLEPVSPALAGRFSTTAPPGKPGRWILNHCATREVPPVPYCLDSCSFVTSLEIIFNFVLLFQSCFGYSRYFAVPYEFFKK